MLFIIIFGTIVKHTIDAIYVHISKYTKELMKKIKMGDGKPTNTPIDQTTLLNEDNKDKKVEQRYIEKRDEYKLV
ncbi:hypothetical protein Lal_00006769 [Lupinus albus]|nr:hypothetical protein Lal_00006769 [Lupinus albus]